MFWLKLTIAIVFAICSFVVLSIQLKDGIAFGMNGEFVQRRKRPLLYWYLIGFEFVLGFSLQAIIVIWMI